MREWRFLAVPPINLSNIKRKTLENAETQKIRKANDLIMTTFSSISKIHASYDFLP